MLETNIRLVKPGPRLYVNVRRMVAQGPSLEPDVLERVCRAMGHDYGIAAAKVPASASEVFVATKDSIGTLTFQGADWEVRLSDSGEPTQRLRLTDPVGKVVVPILLERALLVAVARQTDLWTLDSPRIWYEREPFLCVDGIAAFRRYELGTMYLDDAGVGVVTDVGTVFFTEDTLAYFFEPDLPDEEKGRRRQRFSRLTARQQGQKGTLLYDVGRHKVKCYFEEDLPGMTAINIGTIVVQNTNYPSLYHYYQAKYPWLDVKADAAVVRVSFPGLDRPQPVAAHLVRVRVMNDNVPGSMRSVDKIPPSERKALIESFWTRIGSQPFRSVAPALEPGFWRPNNSRIHSFSLPDVSFGKGQFIASPTDPAGIKTYYRKRQLLLDQGYCYNVPPNIPRTIHCTYPESTGKAAAQLAEDLVRTLSQWTGIPFVTKLVSYRTASDAYDELRSQAESGVVLFVLDSEPAAYYEASFNLPAWRVKRVTDATLREQHVYLANGTRDEGGHTYNPRMGERRWKSFVTLNALDVLQLLDAVPYRISQAGPYEAQLAIDVGYDRRFLALSLLIARDSDKNPSFRLFTNVHHKVDHKKETINELILRDVIVEIFEGAMGRRYDPIRSILILRDGDLRDTEMTAMVQAVESLTKAGLVANDPRVDIVGLHKDASKSVRLWENDGGQVRNPFEGTGVLLNRTTFVLASTGQATLSQGTSDPVVLVASDRCRSITEAAYSVLASAQLNWTNPSVAQRLPLPLKRTDDELSARAAQEIRHLR